MIECGGGGAGGGALRIIRAGTPIPAAPARIRVGGAGRSACGDRASWTRAAVQPALGFSGEPRSERGGQAGREGLGTFASGRAPSPARDVRDRGGGGAATRLGLVKSPHGGESPFARGQKLSGAGRPLSQTVSGPLHEQPESSDDTRAPPRRRPERSGGPDPRPTMTPGVSPPPPAPSPAKGASRGGRASPRGRIFN